ncbi:MAG TPA: type II CAAX endopeptidase family protein, partial [Pyrinomonadaceae bacterium]|nr:type II CAAX endopeptidase family protein [Pyrinomonadaceae bacterium]
IDPNNPPWGLAAGVLTWLGSVVLLFIVPAFFMIIYVIYYNVTHGNAGEGLDQTAVFFIAALATLPAHVLTFAGVWAVVTRFGKLPFWSWLGWGWSKRFGFWTSIGVGVLLLVAGLGFVQVFKGEPTELDKLIQSSMASRITLALLAATTAPLVEELVYRGVLYPVCQRAVGMFWAVVIVSTLFVAPHILQYYNNLGVILVISFLSVCLTLVRARTGKLLPCFVIHLVFNGVQSVLILLEPYMREAAPDVEHKAPAALVHFIQHLF